MFDPVLDLIVLVGVYGILILISLVSFRSQGRRVFWLLPFLLALAAAGVGRLLSPWSRDFSEGFWLAGWGTAPFFFASLTAAFLQYQRWPIWLSIGAVAVGAGLLAAWFVGDPTLTEVLPVALVVIWGIGLAIALGEMLQAFLVNVQPLHRNRIRFWGIVLILLITGGACYFAAIPWADLGTSLAAAALGLYAFLRHDILDVRDLLRQTLRYTLVLGTSLTVYALVINGLLFYLGWQDNTLLTSQIVLLTAAFLALISPLIWLGIQRLADYLLVGSKYDLARTVREYSQGISNIVDLEKLTTVAVGILSEALEVDRGGLILVTPGAEKIYELRIIPGMGLEHQGEDKETWIKSDSPVLAYLTRTGQPLTQYDIDLLPTFASLSSEERAWWRRLQADVYVPVRTSETIIGILFLGPRRSGDPFRAGDLHLLALMANQTVVALQNARLVEDLRQLNLQISNLNQDLTRSNQELERLNAVKSDFIKIAGHELKTPLATVQGYAQMLSNTLASGQLNPTLIRQVAEGIAGGAGRLEEIMRDMLAVSQIESKTLELKRVPMQLSSLITMLQREFGTTLAQRRQNLTVQGIDQLPSISGDFQYLHQAMVNVVGNCIKFTPDGGSISITGHTVAEGNAVEIVIADTGIGIAPEDRERIFTKFYRSGPANLHSTSKTQFKGGGPGLGLPIARGIIEAHGGRIWVESLGYDEVNCPGSQFHVILPVHAPAEKVTPPASLFSPG